jgi:hypothetical protein
MFSELRKLTGTSRMDDEETILAGLRGGLVPFALLSNRVSVMSRFLVKFN